MNYYKVLLPITDEDGTVSNHVVDAQGGPNCVRYNEKKGLMLYCSIEEAQGIVDSFGNGQYWHVDGWAEFPEAAGVTDTVKLELIDEDTYTILHDALAAGQTVTDTGDTDDDASDASDDTLEVVRDGKIAAMSTECENVITGGVDVTLSDGESHHFSLTDKDQLNLNALLTERQQAILEAILSGATEEEIAAVASASIEYHADGELCCYYSYTDFSAIATMVTAWKKYHESYFNSLKAYIMALTDIKTIDAIKYGDTIPEEYQSEVYQTLVAQIAALHADSAEAVS